MALRNASTAYTTALHALLTNEHFDAVLAESIEMAPYLLQVHKAGLRTILDEFNAEYLLQRRAAINDLHRFSYPKALIGCIYSLIQWLKLAAFERRVLQIAAFVWVVAAGNAGAWVYRQPVSRKDILPAPLAVQQVNASQVPAQHRHHGVGKHGHTVLLACAVADDDHMPVDSDIP